MIRRIWDITLTVSDLERATHFYQVILGLQKRYAYPDYAGFDCGGIELGLKTWGELEKPREGEPCVNFLVDDVDVAFERLKQHGVNFTQPPKEAQWGGRIALFTDPDGNRLQMTQVRWAEYFQACAPP